METSILSAAAREILPLLPVLVAVWIRASVLLAAAFAGLWILRRAPARQKHLLCLAAIACSLFVLVIALLGPLFRVAVRPAAVGRGWRMTSLSATLFPPAGTFALPGGMPPLAAEVLRRNPTLDRWTGLWPCAVVAVWIAGALWGWARVLGGRLRLWTLPHSGPARSAGAYDRSVRSLCRRIGIRRRVRVIESTGCATPVTWGILRPLVALPSAMRAWPAVRKRSVLLHELRHVQRADSFSLALAYAVCCLLWFVPPVWAAYSRLYREQEKACDEAVLRSGIRRRAYAASILDTAQLCREGAQLAGFCFPGRRKEYLTDRIKAIVGQGRRGRRSLPLLGLAVACLASVVLLSGAGADPGRAYGALRLREYQVRSADEAAIVDVLIRYEDAFNRHDAARLLSLFSDDAVYMVPCGLIGPGHRLAVPGGRDVFQSTFRTLGFETCYDPQITVSGSTAVACLVVESRAYLTTDYTFVMRKEGADWLVSEAAYRTNRVKS
jgi:beta-lactamase regulating signal transducer with metallopeptidase domain/ketosteroid isomerase-like protein